jgi:hypothetical protein
MLHIAINGQRTAVERSTPQQAQALLYLMLAQGTFPRACVMQGIVMPDGVPMLVPADALLPPPLTVVGSEGA